MEVTTQLYLGKVGDWCDHPDVSVELPLLRVVVVVAGRDGWADLVLHWTGARWDQCAQATWSVEGLVLDEELGEAAERGLEAANAITSADWSARNRVRLEAMLREMRNWLEGQELRARSLRTQIRSLECLAAAAELQGQQLAVARRLVRGWAGTAEELVATAIALADPQDRTEPAVAQVEVVEGLGRTSPL